MHINFKFKNLKSSRKLTEYIEHRVEKLGKYEMKPVNVSVTLRVERGSKRVDVHARGEQKTFQAQGVSNNFFESIDLAVDRLAKQMMKKKAKVQNHRCFERTHLGKIEKLNEALEWTPLEQDAEGQDAA